MRYLPFVLAITLFWTCNTTEYPSPQGPLPPLPEEAGSFSYLALGDSYTIGERVPERERYPNQLADSLKLRGIDLNPVDIVARTGWTTDELNDGIDARSDLQGSYDLVSLLIGVNNQFRGWPIDEYEEEFRGLLDRAIEFAGGEKDRVFIVSIPDYAFTPYGGGRSEISEGIDAFNAVNRMIAEQYEISYFDITPISREGLDKPELVATDGLHPSGVQYARWVSSFMESIKEKLEE